MWVSGKIKPEKEGWYTVTNGEVITEMLFARSQWHDIYGTSFDPDYWLHQETKKVYTK